MVLLQSKERSLLLIGEKHLTYTETEKIECDSKEMISYWLVYGLIKKNPGILFDLYLEIPYYQLINPIEGLITPQEAVSLPYKLRTFQLGSIISDLYDCILPKRRKSCDMKNLRVHVVDPRMRRAASPFFEQSGHLQKLAAEIKFEVDQIKSSPGPKNVSDKLWGKVQTFNAIYADILHKALEVKGRALRTFFGLGANSAIQKEINAIQDNPLTTQNIQLLYNQKVEKVLRDRALMHLRQFSVSWGSPSRRDLALGYPWDQVIEIFREIAEHWLEASSPLLDVFFLARFFSRKKPFGFDIFYGGSDHIKDIEEILLDGFLDEKENRVFLTKSKFTRKVLAFDEKQTHKQCLEIKLEDLELLKSALQEFRKVAETSASPSLPLHVLVQQPLPLISLSQPRPFVPEFFKADREEFLSVVKTLRWKKKDLEALAYYLDSHWNIPVWREIHRVGTKYANASMAEPTTFLSRMFSVFDNTAGSWNLVMDILHKLQKHALTIHQPIPFKIIANNPHACAREYPTEIDRFLQLAKLWKGYQLADKINLLLLDDPSLIHPPLRHQTYRVGDLTKIQPRVPKWRGQDVGNPSYDKPNLIYKILQDNCILVPRLLKNIDSHFL